MNPQINVANQLVKNGHFEDARQILLELCMNNPSDASAHYACASVHDMMGLESDAAPIYERALQLGLQGDELEGAYVGLGSTYRCLGQHQKSIGIFIEGSQRFPHNLAMKVFESMALHESGQHDFAMALLIHCIIEKPPDASIATYRKALQYYSEQYAAKASAQNEQTQQSP